ncbi:hypothetical protein [Ekhidna sp.]|uniref:hypothetical protein n=1 Tax=Ekhidna sp. TaxID=2608089 RepID=UPI003B5052FB
MKYKYYLYIAIGFLLSACQIEDENAPSPDEAFIKYFGELTSYEAKDIEIVYDVIGVNPIGLVVFGTQVSENGDTDFFVLRTDLDGNLIDSVSLGVSDTLAIFDEEGEFVPGGDTLADDWTGDGVADRFRAEETAGQIHVINDFRNGRPGFAIIGTSSITINALGISDWKQFSFGFLDADLNPVTFDGDSLIAFADATEDEFLDFLGNDIIQLNDGSFLLVGAREIDRGGGDSDFDNYFLKVNPVLERIVFEETQGIAGDDEEDIAMRAFEKSNGNLVMIGHSNTPSLRGENFGSNGTNVFYLETDENGTPFNSAAYGIDDSRDPTDATVYNETVSDVIKSSSGFSIVGTSSTSGNEEFAFIMNLSNNGVYLNGSNHHFSAYNDESNTLETLGKGITQSIDNKLIMLGQYLSFNSGNLSRGGEGMFVKFSQGSAPVAGAESFFGLADGNDTVVDAVTLPDGKIVAVANVDFGGGVKLISIIKLNDDGSLD